MKLLKSFKRIVSLIHEFKGNKVRGGDKVEGV